MYILFFTVAEKGQNASKWKKSVTELKNVTEFKKVLWNLKKCFGI